MTTASSCCPIATAMTNFTRCPERGAPPKQLIPDVYEIASFKIDPVGGMIYFVSNKSHYAERQLYRVPLAGGKPQQLTTVPGTHDPVYAPNFAYAADHFSNDMTPPDLWLVGLRGAAKPLQLTHSPLPEFAQHTWATVRYVTFSEPHRRPGADGAGSFCRPVTTPRASLPGNHRLGVHRRSP